MMSARGPVSATIFLALCLSINPCLAAFRGSQNASFLHTSSRTIATNEVESSLQLSLNEVLGGGRDVAARRLAAIEASIWQTFQALPKNEQGRLGPKAVRYVVHGYFAREHGWLIEGLEPHGMRNNVTEVHEVSILQDKAPALVEALLESRQSDRGLALSDVVTMIAALERLIFDESMELLSTAYDVNGQSMGSAIDEDALHEVLRSYLLIFRSSNREDLSKADYHQKVKKALATRSSYRDLSEFAGDTLMNFDFEHRGHRNPFTPQQYSFETVSQITEVMTHGYGKWQNAECREMKAALMDLDPSGTGRVPLSNFYSQPTDAVFTFSESVDYLRQTGALDETGRGGPAVLIPNYLAGPTNCIASSSYYSVCCMNECEGLMNEIEHKIQAPKASPERLLGLVGNLSSSTVDGPRTFPSALKEKLHAIASHHEGEVPIHGRFFAQRLHFAFPNECPYPQITENAAVLTPSQWLDAKVWTASENERQQHIEVNNTTATEEVPFMSQWSDDEVLPVLEPQKARRGALARLLRWGVQIAGIVVVLRSAVAAWSGGVHAYKGQQAKDKKEQLPW